MIRKITLCVIIVFSQYRQVKVSGSGRHGLLCCGMDPSGDPGHQLSELSKQAPKVGDRSRALIAYCTHRKHECMHSKKYYYTLSMSVSEGMNILV